MLEVKTDEDLERIIDQKHLLWKEAEKKAFAEILVTIGVDDAKKKLDVYSAKGQDIFKI